ncbi:MAG: hypothetical protein M1830_010642 [Pleopsidium flavum]|nr:MAG: hypothetical protein M1830_010642 [Pleopsidium flavum]
MPPRSTVNEADLEEAFLKGSGPGGQKINKTSSAVQLKHLPTGIVIKSQETRSRTQNRKIARRVLAEKLEVMEKGSESRVAVKGEVKRKKKASQSKKTKRKYKALEEAGAMAATEGVVEGGQNETNQDNGREEEDSDATAKFGHSGRFEEKRDGRERPPDPPRI